MRGAIVICLMLGAAGGAAAQTTPAELAATAPAASAPAAETPQAAVQPAANLLVSAPPLSLDELVDAKLQTPAEAGPKPLTPLEMEACRRMKEEAAAKPEASTGQKVGGAVAGTAGQIAGFTVGGPVGAALVGTASGFVGKAVGGAVGGKPEKREPDRLLMSECEARMPASVIPAPTATAAR